MANTPISTLTFSTTEDGKIYGRRQIEQQKVLPSLGEDFDWTVRDYSKFCDMMRSELQARFPERTRWTEADVEITLIELLASELDLLSDMLDRVTTEAYLDTVREPESLRCLLKLIDYDAVKEAQHNGYIQKQPTFMQDCLALSQFWYNNPSYEHAAQQEALQRMHVQKRMVTLNDFKNLLAQHPLVLQAKATVHWLGSWNVICVTVYLQNDFTLDESTLSYDSSLAKEIDAFNEQNELIDFDLETNTSSPPSPRTLLDDYIKKYRMAGQEILLQDVAPIAIGMEMSVLVSENYAIADIREQIEQQLSGEPDGLFTAGQRQVGETLYISEIFFQLNKINGIDMVTIENFRRLIPIAGDQSDAEKIVISDNQVIICKNDANDSTSGFYTLSLTGGMAS